MVTYASEIETHYDAFLSIGTVINCKGALFIVPHFHSSATAF